MNQTSDTDDASFTAGFSSEFQARFRRFVFDAFSNFPINAHGLVVVETRMVRQQTKILKIDRTGIMQADLVITNI